MNGLLDTIIGASSPEEVNIVRAKQFFSDLERAINEAVKDSKYFEKTVEDSIDTIESEFSWFSDYAYELFQFYSDATETLDYYRAEIEARLDEDETKEYVALQVQEKIKKA